MVINGRSYLDLKKIVLIKSYNDVKECITFSTVRCANSCPYKIVLTKLHHSANTVCTL